VTPQPNHARAAAAVVATLSCLSAHAQDANSSYMRFGGSIDTVVRHDDGGDSSTWSLSPGGARSSRLTYSIKEAVTPDLAATVVLEGAFAPDTGAGASNPPGVPNGAFSFGRTSHVGLGSDSMGYITLGRQYTPIQATTAGSINDPFGGSWIGGIATVYNKVSSASNSIVYSYGYTAEAMLRPAPRNGLGVSVMYSFSEEPQPLTDAGKQYGANVSYGGSNWWVGYAFHRQIGNNQQISTALPTSESPRTTYQWIGGAYEFGRVRLSLGFNTGRNDTRAVDRRNWSVGLNWGVGERGTIRALYGRANDRTAANGDFSTVQLSYMYDLSKRTALYAVWGNVDNAPNTANALAGALGPVTRGATATTTAFGIRHSF
jgi:predicted porin